jgi:hypothetical protein
MLITVMLLRSAERWTSISTSAWAPGPASPPSAASSEVSRVSEPISRTLSGVRPKASGFSTPTAAAWLPSKSLELLMLPDRWT